MTARVLLVDDERNLRQTLAEIFAEQGLEVMQAESGETALAMIRAREPDLIFSDWRMANGDGESLLRALQQQPGLLQRLPVIVMTAYGTSDIAIRAIRLGAYDFVTKPLDLDEVSATAARALAHARLQREVDDLRGRLHADAAIVAPQMIGTSRPMLDVFKAIGRVASTESSVLIVGESGTGKELVAQSIHDNSPRRGRAFVAINCSALPADLLEAELFGYERGAFTGATQRKPGRFEAAAGGTVFLDEIGDLPLALQPKLLRVLQDHHIERLGSNESIHADFRLVAATHRDLPAAIDEGTFRQDLYFRINAFTVPLPSLRDRRSDIVSLVEHFSARIAARDRLLPPRFADPTLVALQQYHYPGNVRELEHLVERALVLSQGRVVLPEHLSFAQQAAASAPALPEALLALPFHESVEAWERLLIQRALQDSGGSKTEAARRLGMHRRLLYEKLQRWKLT
jgi:DNA-binding NtrC family response regulator